MSIWQRHIPWAGGWQRLFLESPSIGLDEAYDNQITAGELHAYVQQNVIQQSSGSQTPELQGDADRVLVRFQ